MIRRLRLVLGAEHQATYTRFLVWATAYGILQGLAVSFLVPVADHLVAGDRAGVWRWLAIMAVVVAACAIAHYVQAMLGFTVALTTLRTMHLRIGDHLVRLPIGWFAGQVGSVSQVASKGTLAVGGAAAHLLTPLVTGIAGPATVAVSLLFFDWRLGLALVIAAPLIALAARATVGLIARGDAATHAAAVEANDRILEFARCQPALRASGRAIDGYQPLHDAIEGQRAVARRSMIDSVLGLSISGVTIQFVFSTLVVLSAVLALGGELSAARLLAVLGIMTRFVQPLAEIGEFGGPIRGASNELARIQSIMDAQPLPEPAGPATLTRPGAVELERVRFGYDPTTPVLDGVSLRVEPGTMTALVGPSGSGKTTITRLVARFYDVDSGTVRVGGVDVRTQTTEQLMAQLSLVFQDVYLFDDTLRENIRVGNPAATAAEVDRAAGLAGVSEIVARLADGWDTRVGEAGSALSGGERQRVSIARAILKRAPVVLLDEATAALDPGNEAHLQRSLQVLRRDAALLVIAHKLSTVTAADQILVLGDDGTIAEAGTHADLLAAGGRYAAFWRERSRARGWRLPARPAEVAR